MRMITAGLDLAGAAMHIFIAGSNCWPGGHVAGGVAAGGGGSAISAIGGMAWATAGAATCARAGNPEPATNAAVMPKIANRMAFARSSLRMQGVVMPIQPS